MIRGVMKISSSCLSVLSMAARTFRPLSEQALADIRKRAASAAADGKYEPFKVSSQYDGTVHNPQWLG